MTNFRDRVQQKLKEQGVSGRMDLQLSDAKVIEAGNAVRCIASYSTIQGPPSTYDIQHWLRVKMDLFGDRVSARPETIAVYPEINSVSFIVDQKRVRQPLSCTSEMSKAGVDLFLDNDNQLWEVVQGGQGPGYIVRREDTSIEEMLQIRKDALQGTMSARKTVTLASLDSIPSAGGGFASVDIGDTVDFYHDGQIHRGQVQSVGAAGVKVSSLGGTFPIQPEAITSVVEKSAGAKKEQDSIMRRYFGLVYPGNPEMTEIISPTATGPIADNRPPPGGEELKPIEVAASTRISGTARPFVKTSK